MYYVVCLVDHWVWLTTVASHILVATVLNYYWSIENPPSYEATVLSNILPYCYSSYTKATSFTVAVLALTVHCTWPRSSAFDCTVATAVTATQLSAHASQIQYFLFR